MLTLLIAVAPLTVTELPVPDVPELPKPDVPEVPLPPIVALTKPV